MRARHLLALGRLALLLARPPLVALLVTFAALGTARAGAPDDVGALSRTAAVVVGFLVAAVALNDLADEEIDRINLPDDRRRPLVVGLASRRDMIVLGSVGAAVALAASLTLSWPGPAVVGAGLALAAGYSLRPLRLAERGIVAPLLLPLGYVGVPYLAGLLAARAGVRPADLAVLGGLYVGFIGRIVLKDFRDVRGDALLGKRTFLVRHGRVPTCVLSGACWLAGSAVLTVLDEVTPVLVASYLVQVAVVVVLLVALARSTSRRVDDRLIGAVAVAGRGLVLVVLAHESLRSAALGPATGAAVVTAITALLTAATVVMAVLGPRPPRGAVAPGGVTPDGLAPDGLAPAGLASGDGPPVAGVPGGIVAAERAEAAPDSP